MYFKGSILEEYPKCRRVFIDSSDNSPHQSEFGGADFAHSSRSVMDGGTTTLGGSFLLFWLYRVCQ